MATPPTFVASYVTAFNTATTPKNTTTNVTGSTGDVLVGLVANSNDNGNENYTVTSSPAETWTKQPESTGTTNADSWAQTSTTILTAGRTGMTVTLTRTADTGTANFFGLAVAHFSGSPGLGNTAASGRVTGAPSWSFTTSADNSAVAAVFVDWDAGDGTTRTWRTVNGVTPSAGNSQELTYFRDASQYAVYIAYWSDAGTAGVHTLGLSAPAAGTWVAAAAEVLAVPVTTTPVFLRPTQAARLITR